MIPNDVSMVTSTNDGSIVLSDYLRSLQVKQLSLIQSTQQFLNKRASAKDSKVKLVEKISFQIGDYVLLSYPSRPPSKLAGLYRGPLVIHNKLRDDIYEVRDLITDRIYEVHFSRIHALNLPSDLDHSELLRFAGIDHAEYVVDFIVNHRGNIRKKREMEFLIRWKGYEPGDDTWESYSVVKDLAALDEYSAAHPELRLG
jgi:hypothetical protein